MRTLQIVHLIFGSCISLTIMAEEPLKVSCNNQAVCALVEVKTGKILISGLSATPTIRAISNDFFEIRTSCGSPCSASAYYDQRGGRISKTFPDVISMLPEPGIVIFVAAGKIMCSSVFSSDKKPLQIKTKWPLAETASVISAVVSAEFLSPASVKLTYLTGAEFKEVTETISLKIVAKE